MMEDKKDIHSEPLEGVKEEYTGVEEKREWIVSAHR